MEKQVKNEENKSKNEGTHMKEAKTPPTKHGKGGKEGFHSVSVDFFGIL